MTTEFLCGDVIEMLRGYGDETFTACLCDPPYGLSQEPDMAEVLTHWLAGDTYKHNGGGFMSKSWDSFVPGPEYWREVYRVLKPGAVLLAFAGTRTADLLGIAIRLAGFERWDTLIYCFGSGFPKSTAIDKQIDKAAGIERNVIGPKVYPDGTRAHNSAAHHDGYLRPFMGDDDWQGCKETAPATPLARVFAGYGTALKPAVEMILAFRKPRSGTYAACAVAHGTGALAIDACRVKTGENICTHSNGKRAAYAGPCLHESETRTDGHQTEGQLLGRWPSNLLLDSAAADALGEMSGRLGRKDDRDVKIQRGPRNVTCYGGGWGYDASPTYGDIGDASRFFPHLSHGDADEAGWPEDALRFFYTGKASRAEREAGLDEMTTGLPSLDRGSRWCVDCGKTYNGTNDHSHCSGNMRTAMAHTLYCHHPCVKPLALTRWLATLIRPPEEYLDDAMLLCPFSGVASEIIGAVLAGWKNIVGIELDPEYVSIGKARLAYWQRAYEQTGISDPKELLKAARKLAPLPLFDLVAAK